MSVFFPVERTSCQQMRRSIELDSMTRWPVQLSGSPNKRWTRNHRSCCCDIRFVNSMDGEFYSDSWCMSPPQQKFCTPKRAACRRKRQGNVIQVGHSLQGKTSNQCHRLVTFLSFSLSAGVPLCTLAGWIWSWPAGFGLSFCK